MRLNVKAVTFSAGLLWGVALFLVGLANMIWSGYGQALLDLAASIYPGYRATPSWGQAILGLLYGLVDGSIGGAVFAWLYNCLASGKSNGTPENAADRA